MFEFLFTLPRGFNPCTEFDKAAANVKTLGMTRDRAEFFDDGQVLVTAVLTGVRKSVCGGRQQRFASESSQIAVVVPDQTLTRFGHLFVKA